MGINFRENESPGKVGKEWPSLISEVTAFTKPLSIKQKILS
jgi:hypothetical protein